MLERVWRKGKLLHCWWECKLVQPLWRTVWRFLKKLEIELPYDPAIPLLGIHTEETRSERDTCTPVFITALFIIARTWKQPRCPSADKWIRKLWYIYTMEYYSDIKKNSFESVLKRWMKLEPIIQSEVSQGVVCYNHQACLVHKEIYSMVKSGDFPNIIASELESWTQIQNSFQIPCSYNIPYSLYQIPIKDFLGLCHATPTMEWDPEGSVYSESGFLGQE